MGGKAEPIASRSLKRNRRHHRSCILSLYQLRFFRAEKLVAERELHATDEGMARLKAAANCYTSGVEYDSAELWEGTQRIEWTPPKSAAAIIQGRQENIIDKEVALSNSVWARDNLSDLNS
jgi:hypothetical protein